ncbi:MAG: hypothetical protein JWN70_884 [Planctomycetaceae bacterium]|nr:hypothetical protein [Planctomycetaceae bacterium]
MTKTEWFRNTSWNEAIEETFNDRIRRARSKDQYLRIQASLLVASHPEVALRLLDSYFELPDPFDKAQAHVDRAAAFTALGRLDEALTSYDAALAQEKLQPQILTLAYIELPYLIAAHRVRGQYARAKQLLQDHASRLSFPVDHFRWHAALALMAIDTGDPVLAKRHATNALEMAAAEHSGFRYHPNLGLVTNQYDNLVQKMVACRNA